MEEIPESNWFLNNSQMFLQQTRQAT